MVKRRAKYFLFSTVLFIACQGGSAIAMQHLSVTSCNPKSLGKSQSFIRLLHVKLDDSGVTVGTKHIGWDIKELVLFLANSIKKGYSQSIAREIKKVLCADKRFIKSDIGTKYVARMISACIVWLNLSNDERRNKGCRMVSNSLVRTWFLRKINLAYENWLDTQEYPVIKKTVAISSPHRTREKCGLQGNKFGKKFRKKFNEMLIL